MQIVIRASILFLFLWLLMRALGRRELAEMSAFELVLLIVMGDLIQQGVTSSDNSVTGAVIAVSTFALWMLLLSYAMYRFRRLRTLLEGRPVVIVSNGEPMEQMMRYERLTLDEVKDAAREHGIADLREVSLGVLESDGKFSFIRNDDRRPEAPAKHKL